MLLLIGHLHLLITFSGGLETALKPNGLMTEGEIFLAIGVKDRKTVVTACHLILKLN